MPCLRLLLAACLTQNSWNSPRLAIRRPIANSSLPFAENKTVIRRITRHTEDAEDVLQEAFLRALRHLHSFDGRVAFSTWLTRIAVNCALMLLRTRRAHPENSIDNKLDDGQWLAFDVRDLSPDPERIFLQNEENFAVHPRC